MLNLNIFLIILSIESILSLYSTDLCYSTSESVCNNINHNYYCSKNVCSLNKETCNNYSNRVRSFFNFHSFHLLIKLKKEIKHCSSYESLDLNKYCLNSHDCIQTKKLIIFGLELKYRIKNGDCECPDYFKQKCDRKYCGIDFNSCKMIQNLPENIKIKDCHDRKMYYKVTQEEQVYSRF